MQNDVSKIIDKDGNILVEYMYDAWGNEVYIETSGTIGELLAKINPYRYRGHRYDEETQLFYLNSRYYSPDMGRFINADGIIGESGDILGHNMYAYAQNNPVNRIDPSGYVSFWLEITIAILVDVTVRAIVGPMTGGAGLLIAEVLAEVLTYVIIKTCDKEPINLTELLITVGAGMIGGRLLEKGLKIASKSMGRAFKNVDLSSVTKGAGNAADSKRLYRVMSEGELNAVKETGFLRGGREGTTYFTDSYFKSSSKAQSRLALPNKPTHIMEFEILNNPKIISGNKVTPNYGQIGGGREYFTDDLIQVRILNYQRLIP